MSTRPQGPLGPRPLGGLLGDDREVASELSPKGDKKNEVFANLCLSFVGQGLLLGSWFLSIFNQHRVLPRRTLGSKHTHSGVSGASQIRTAQLQQAAVCDKLRGHRRTSGGIRYMSIRCRYVHKIEIHPLDGDMSIRYRYIYKMEIQP